MPFWSLALASGAPEELVTKLAEVSDDLGLPKEFSTKVLAQVDDLEAKTPDFPDHIDRTDLELVTIDPPSATDLDQAVYIERSPVGYRVFYAIADVAAWVQPGSAVDLEAHQRCQTYYAPHTRLPLHPPKLSESAASLLADGIARPAMLWELTLDSAGQLVDTKLTRAMVRNRAKLSYQQVQKQLNNGTASTSLKLLREVGLLRQKIEQQRGGISLNLPEQEIISDGNSWQLVYRTTLPIENWNAQISLLTGIAAAGIMQKARIGLLRTLAPATDDSLARLRRIAKTLKITWEKDWDYPRFVRSLNPEIPNHLAMVNACTMLFRGAGYIAFDGELPAGDITHAALATSYAHTTAPLRRLVDRYVLEVCYACVNGLEVPPWVKQALPKLPDEMSASTTKAKRFEKALVDLTEVLLLKDRLGEQFLAVVTNYNSKYDFGEIQLTEPAVEARARGIAAKDLGQEIKVELKSASFAEGQVLFVAI
ncbi:MAG: ribonuclease II [Propionibacterium sp.]|nr:MAG: ribonuclease II [Propionibacterium sp.]